MEQNINDIALVTLLQLRKGYLRSHWEPDLSREDCKPLLPVSCFFLYLSVVIFTLTAHFPNKLQRKMLFMQITLIHTAESLTVISIFLIQAFSTFCVRYYKKVDDCSSLGKAIPKQQATAQYFFFFPLIGSKTPKLSVQERYKHSAVGFQIQYPVLIVDICMRLKETK